MIENYHRIYLRVIPRASKNKLEKLSSKEYKIWVTAPPEKGKANQAVIKFLADYFQKSPDQIKIIAGKSSRKKIVDIF